MKEKVDQTHTLVDFYINSLNERGIEPDVAVSSAGQFFGLVCKDCNLSGEQFLYLCKGIAEKLTWNKEDSTVEDEQQPK